MEIFFVGRRMGLELKFGCFLCVVMTIGRSPSAIKSEVPFSNDGLAQDSVLFRIVLFLDTLFDPVEV